jgi:hypothetical protein
LLSKKNGRCFCRDGAKHLLFACTCKHAIVTSSIEVMRLPSSLLNERTDSTTFSSSKGGGNT